MGRDDDDGAVVVSGSVVGGVVTGAGAAVVVGIASRTASDDAPQPVTAAMSATETTILRPAAKADDRFILNSCSIERDKEPTSR